MIDMIANCDKINVIGRLGENEHRRVKFPIAEYLEMYPGAVVSLLNRLPGTDTAYPVATTTTDSEYLYWTVTSADLSREGQGQCELVVMLGDVVAKSVIYITRVLPALDGSGEAPEPWDEWQIEFARMKAEAEAAAVAATEARADAQTEAAAAAESADNARDAAQAAERIADDLGDFETAMAAVEAAKTDAEQSATEAAGSATAAATSEGNAAGSATAAAGSASAAASSAAAAAASEAAARAVEESIPADYSELSADVSDLKTEMGDKLDAPATAGTSGQVLTSDGQGGQSWETPSGGDVTDVTVGNYSVVDNGIAKIKIGNGLRIGNNSDHAILVSESNQGQIRTRVSYSVITPDVQHLSTFYGLAFAAGDTTQASKTVLGQYTDSAKSAISQMLNGSVPVTGSTPSITALPGIRYVCGEVTTLDITLPASGCVDVVFESGSTATVLTVTPPTGVTLKWANGFDPTALEANATYEINIADGLGVAGSWT